MIKNERRNQITFGLSPRVAGEEDKLYHTIKASAIYHSIQFIANKKINKEDTITIFTEFMSSVIFEKSLIPIFFEDEEGFQKTSFNKDTGYFSKKNIRVLDLYFCKESFLFNINILLKILKERKLTNIKINNIKNLQPYQIIEELI